MSSLGHCALHLTNHYHFILLLVRDYLCPVYYNFALGFFQGGINNKIIESDTRLYHIRGTNDVNTRAIEVRNCYCISRLTVQSLSLYDAHRLAYTLKTHYH